MVGAIVERIISSIFQIIFEIIFMGTGEIILYILTAGKKKPIWKRNEKGMMRILFKKTLIQIECKTFNKKCNRKIML